MKPYSSKCTTIGMRVFCNSMNIPCKAAIIIKRYLIVSLLNDLESKKPDILAYVQNLTIFHNEYKLVKYISRCDVSALIA